MKLWATPPARTPLSSPAGLTNKGRHRERMDRRAGPVDRGLPCRLECRAAPQPRPAARHGDDCLGRCRGGGAVPAVSAVAGTAEPAIPPRLVRAPYGLSHAVDLRLPLG